MIPNRKLLKAQTHTLTTEIQTLIIIWINATKTTTYFLWNRNSVRIMLFLKIAFNSKNKFSVVFNVSLLY